MSIMAIKKVKQYVVCVNNQGCEVSLEKRKIYQVISDKTAEQKNLLRVKDETGQSYLYPQRFFMTIKLPQPVLKAIRRAA
jgi:hypothetical protein